MRGGRPRRGCGSGGVGVGVWGGGAGLALGCGWVLGLRGWAMVVGCGWVVVLRGRAGVVLGLRWGRLDTAGSVVSVAVVGLCRGLYVLVWGLACVFGLLGVPFGCSWAALGVSLSSLCRVGVGGGLCEWLMAWTLGWSMRCRVGLGTGR